MLLPDFANMMVRRGCTGSDKTFFGDYSGYPYTIAYYKGTAGGITGYTLQVLFDRNPPRSLFSGLIKQMKGTLAITRQQSTASTQMNVSVTCKADAQLEQSMDMLLAAVTSLAAQNGLSVPVTCPLCNQPGCDSYASIGGYYRQAHAACVQNQTIQQQATVAKNQTGGSYALGALGALLGAIVGIIPSVIVIIFFNFISAWLCMLIPICAYFGYKLLRGKMTKAVIAFVAVASLLMVPFMDYVISAYTLYDQTGAMLSLAYYIEILMSFPEEILPSYGQILLFTGIGFFLSIGITTRNNSHVMQAATSSAVSLRPIPGVTPQQQIPAAPPYSAPMGAPAPQNPAGL